MRNLFPYAGAFLLLSVAYVQAQMPLAEKAPPEPIAGVHVQVQPHAPIPPTPDLVSVHAGAVADEDGLDLERITTADVLS